MKRLHSLLSGLQLSQKLTLAVFCVVLLPLAVASSVLFSAMQSLIAQDRMQDVEHEIQGVQARLERTVDLCNMTTQVFTGSARLREMLLMAEETEISTDALVEFYRKDIATLEKLVTSNPYLYQVRVYVENDSLPEMMPVLYHSRRMRRLAWSGEYTSGSWHFDYADTLYPGHVIKPTPHLMSLVTSLDDYDAGSLGVIEVAVRMDEVIPELFDDAADGWSVLVTGDGELVCGDSQRAFWDANRDSIFARMEALSGQLGTVSMRLDGGTAWVTIAPLSQIGGSYLVVTPPGELTRRLSSFRQAYLLGLAGLLLLLAFAIRFIVRRILRRLYLVFSAITAVEKGDLSATIPALGSDEVGQLANRLNKMMGRITGLMEENVSKRLLAKNSEIRALQSQINAHFIYNVLEAIKMMAIVERQHEMADAIQSLGELLRYSMHWSTPTATLAEEMENAENYLRLMNLRFDHQATLRCDIPEELLGAVMPKMTLQPILENAIIHGTQELASDTVIDLVARHEEGAFTVTVTDYGRGIDETALFSLRKKLDGARDNVPGKSIGLKNVQDRIVMEYGENYGLAVESDAGKFTRVVICLPGGEEVAES